MLFSYSDVKADRHEEVGWAPSAYGMSKVGVTLMTPIQQQQFDSDETRKDIVVNAVSLSIHVAIIFNHA
jgi:hypothetical protein